MSKIMLFCLFLFTFCKSNKESVTGVRAFAAAEKSADQASDFEVLVYAESTTAAYNSFLMKNGIQKVGFIGDAQFLDPAVKFKISPKMMDQELQRAYPDPLATGIAYIDLEAPYLDHIMNADVNTSEFKNSKKLFLDILAYAKKARPNVKWGFYNIPFTNYWGRTQEFYNKDERIKEIIKNSDVLFPSIYIFYNHVNFKIENKTYLQENTEQMIRIGKKYQKKVYPLIMSRYHPSSGKLAYETIDDADFRLYFSTIKNTEYNGKGIDGVVLWNADKYFYNTSEKKVVEEAKTSRSTFDNFYDNYLINKLSIMLEK